MKKDIGGLILSSLILLIGLFLIVEFFVLLTRSKRWPIVTGSITGSRIEEGKDSESNSIIYMVKISLVYNFAGLATYNHNTVYRSYSYSKASAKRSDYPIGKPIKVWCNPKKPTRCMLAEDFSGLWVMLPFGILFVGAAVAWFI